MKKGNIFPRTRARWNSARVPAGGKELPTWFNFNFITAQCGLEVYSEGDFQPARWCYQENGTIGYWGFYSNGSEGGQWKVFLIPDFYQERRCILRLQQFNPTFGNPVCQTITTPGAWSSVCNNVTALGVVFNTVQIQEFPWLTVPSHIALWPMRYAEIEALGQNKQDTSPLSWTDTVPTHLV